MAKLSLAAGTTSKTVKVFIQNSSVTTGAGLGSLVYNTSNLIGYYIREGANASVAISLATATLGTWATGGFVVVDGANMLGLYELGIPDAALAAGAASVTIMLSGAANMAPCVLEIELTAVNNQDAVRYGMSALPNAAAAAAGGLPTIGVTIPNATAGAAGGLLIAGANAATTFATLTSTGAFSINGVSNVSQTGDNYVRIGALGAGLTALAPSATALTTATWTNARAANLDNLDATVSSRLSSAGYSASLPVNFGILAIDGFGDVTYNNAAPPSAASIATAVFTTQLTESYAALHAAPTLAQITFEMRGILAEGNTAGTVLTTKKIDGATQAETFTLNSATAPTSITRAT